MAEFPPIFRLRMLDGANGFRLDGENGHAYAGTSVSTAGDVNGDGFEDLIIGSPYAQPGDNRGLGAAYIVFGRAEGFPASSVLGPELGLKLFGEHDGSATGSTVGGGGDFNGDGFDDFVISELSATYGRFGLCCVRPRVARTDARPRRH